jgi:hypothetical protein
LCLEKIAALLCDALSFNFPITSLSFFIESLFFWLLQCELLEIKL